MIGQEIKRDPGLNLAYYVKEGKGVLDGKVSCNLMRDLGLNLTYTKEGKGY